MDEISAADVAEQEAVQTAVEQAKAFRANLEDVGLSYGQLLRLLEAYRNLGDIARNAITGWERGEGWPAGIAEKEYTMTRLKTNKSTLYKLVAEYEQLPVRKQTIFQKTHRQPSYWLEWPDRDLWCKAHLSAVMGRPVLAVTKYQNGQEVSSAAHTLNIADLKERGMTETITTSAERRRTERGASHGAV